MSEQRTHAMVVRFIRDFTENEKRREQAIVRLEGRIHEIEGMVKEFGVTLKCFSGLLNGLESRLTTKVAPLEFERLVTDVEAFKIATKGQVALQRLANRAIGDWVYNPDFDHEFAMHNALNETLDMHNALNEILEK